MIKQTEQNDVLGDFTKRLEKIGIEYMRTGSMALVHYAIPRATVDINIVVNLLPESLDKFIKEFVGDYYIPLRSAKDAVNGKRMFNALNQKTIIKVDCIILKNDEFQKFVFSRRQRVNYEGVFEVWIITREDLIPSKLIWAKKSNSERQLLDVASIIRHGFDEKYIAEWLEKLKLTELFEKSKNLLEQNYVDGYDS